MTPPPFPMLQNGAASPVLQWEEEFMVTGGGFPANPQLNSTVAAISYFE